MSLYFDHAATTRLSENVKNDILNNLDKFGNPSSIYTLGFETNKIIENSRKTIAECINCRPEEIFFTSGASEANSWALQQAFVCEQYEHHSILNNPRRTRNPAFYNNVDTATTMLVNNETGVINDIKLYKAIYSGMCPKLYHFHTDATQAIGNIHIDVQKLDVETMSFSGHKIHAPKGVGVLYVKKDFQQYLEPMIYGGKQERGLRGGTENILGISAMGVAMRDACNNVGRKEIYCRMLKNHFLDRMIMSGLDFCINDNERPVISNIISISFKNIESEAILLQLDLKDISISGGSACNSGSNEPSETLKWLQIPEEYINGTIRISFDLENTVEDVDILCDELIKIINKFSLNWLDDVKK